MSAQDDLFDAVEALRSEGKDLRAVLREVEECWEESIQRELRATQDEINRRRLKERQRHT